MIELLMAYKYWMIVPLAVIEGPIISVVAGFLTTLGVFHPLLVFAVVVIGDIAGDALQYLLGHSGKRLLPYFGITEDKIEKSKIYFHANRRKTLIASKLLYGIGSAGLIAAGALHVPYWKYFRTCALISVIQSATMMTVGIFFGHAYVVIDKYMNYYAAIASVGVLVVILFVFIRKYKKEVSEEIKL